MKHFFITYYVGILALLFIINNLVLSHFQVGGLLYQLIVITCIILNVLIIVTYKKDVKYKSLGILIFLFLCLFSKDRFQLLFAMSSILPFLWSNFLESKHIKIFTVCIAIFISIFYIPLFLLFLLLSYTEMRQDKGSNGIYEDTHYYCVDHYEIYSYSAGATDKFHYYIGKYYKILNIDSIIYIYYRDGNEKTYKEYQDFLNSHTCRLVDDLDEFK